MEDYRKKYEDALERAKEELGSGCFNKGSIEYIFPELKESAGEKIRKALIDYFEGWQTRAIDENAAYYKDIAIKDILAWLEKVKDFDKQLEEAYKNSDEVQYKRGYDDGYVDGMAAARKKELKKQATIKDGNSIDPHFVKPIAINESEVDVKVEPSWFYDKADLSGNSEEYRKAYYDGWNNCAQQYLRYKSESNDVIKCLINGMERLKYDRFINWGTEMWHMKVEDILHGLRNLEKGLINELPHSQVTKKSDKVWNEDDEKNLQGVIDEIQANKSSAPEYDLKTYDKFLSWLESIKGRIQPQPKQGGWSEEDKEMKDLIDEISCCNDDVDYETHVRITRWLNELKQRLS